MFLSAGLGIPEKWGICKMVILCLGFWSILLQFYLWLFDFFVFVLIACFIVCCPDYCLCTWPHEQNWGTWQSYEDHRDGALHIFPQSCPAGFPQALGLLPTPMDPTFFSSSPVIARSIYVFPGAPLGSSHSSSWSSYMGAACHCPESRCHLGVAAMNGGLFEMTPTSR